MRAWPVGEDEAAWLRFVAERATALPFGDEYRRYAFFAVRDLLAGGWRADAIRTLARLETGPHEAEKAQDFERGTSQLVEVARFYGRLGDEVARRRVLGLVVDLAATMKRKSSRTYFERLAREPPGAEEEVATAAAPGVVNPEEAARAALARLVPTEWNLMVPACALRRAIEALADREPAAAHDLLETALERFGRGDLDGRGFASGAAYVELARAARVLGDARARGLLEKAVAVAGDQRSMIVADVAEAYSEQGAHDDALVWAKKVRKAWRATAIAEALARASRWEELREVLHGIEDPTTALRTAWALRELLAAPTRRTRG